MPRIDYEDYKRKFTRLRSELKDKLSQLKRRREILDAMPIDTLSHADKEDVTALIEQLDTEITQADKKHDNILLEELALERAQTVGFDYQRPKRSLGRFLPPVAPGVKEVTDATIHSMSTIRHWPTAISISLAYVGCAYVFLQYLPPAAIAAPVGLFIYTEYPASVAQLVGVIIVLVMIVLTLLVQLRPSLSALDKKHSNQLAYFWLGSERWSWKQRLTACIIYTVKSPWLLIAPLIVAPIRFASSVTLLWLYLSNEARLRTAPQAIVATARYHSAYRRALLSVSIIGIIIATTLLFVR